MDASLFGDACPGTSKYMEVHYTCRSLEQATTTPRPIPPWHRELGATPATQRTTTTSRRPTTATTPKSTTTTSVARTTAAARVTQSVNGVQVMREDLPVDDHEVLVLRGEEDEDKEGYCHPETARNLFWDWTAPGKDSVQPCPPGTAGFASRRCQTDSNWSSQGPDLSKCQSLWLARLESRLHAGGAVAPIARELAALTETKTVYGGDLPVAAALVGGLVHRLRQDLYTVSMEEKEAEAEGLLQNVLRAASNVLSDEQRAAWFDVSEEQRSSHATALVLGVEDAALLLAETVNNEKSIIEATDNVVASIRIMRRKSVKDQVRKEIKYQLLLLMMKVAVVVLKCIL